MRHDRKSRSKRFDGYEEWFARDLDLPVIVACARIAAARPRLERRRHATHAALPTRVGSLPRCHFVFVSDRRLFDFSRSC